MYKFTEIPPPDTGMFSEKFLDALPMGDYCFKENKLFRIDSESNNANTSTAAADKLSATLRNLINVLGDK